MFPVTPGFVALTTSEERKELGSIRRPSFGPSSVGPNHDPRCTRNHLQLWFAFWQSDFKGGKIPSWHVMSAGPFHHSTLSMRGLQEWRLV